MSGVLWIATIVMTVLAFVFVIQPLIVSDRRKTIGLLALGIPLVAAALYVVLGSPKTESGHGDAAETIVARSESAVDGSNQKVGSVSSMVDGLRARLEQNPNDAKGWLLLARSYKHLNRPGDAAYAYGQAVLLGEVDSELAPLLTANSDDGAAQIFGNLSLSLHAAEVVQPTDTVFIFARAANEAGVPAAVLQRPASELPIDFLLNDSQAMVEDVKLSDFESVVVTARISRSGNATEALQGLEAKSEPVVVADNKHINLIIE